MFVGSCVITAANLSGLVRELMAQAPLDNDRMRQRLVDAAEVCFHRHGLAKTTIEDIASEALVSRSTVYRHVGDRDELLLEVLLRAADRFFDRLQKRVTTELTISGALVDGVLYTLASVRRDEDLMLLFAPEAIGYTTRIAGSSEAIFARTAERLRPMIEPAQEAGEMRSDLTVEEIAQWLTRIVFSLLVLPGGVDSPDEVRDQLERFLVPALIPDDRVCVLTRDL